MPKRLSQDEFIKRVETKYPGKYEVIGTYKNNHTVLKIKCLSCNHIWSTTPTYLLKIGCPKCKGNMPKTKDDLEKLVPNCEILNDYSDFNSELFVRCKICKHEFKSSTSALIRYGCPKCKRQAQLTHENFISKIETCFPNKFEIIGEYKSLGIPIKTCCLTCGYEWNSTPANLLSGAGCPQCYGNKKKTHEEFVKEYEQKFGDRAIFLEEYKTANTKILVECKECHNKWKVTPSSLLNGRWCPVCMDQRKSHEQFIRELETVSPNQFEVLEDYKSASSKILIRCKKCNYTYRTRAAHLVEGQGCPRCKESGGERKISNLLMESNINYTSQYRIKDCKNKAVLRFDFAAFNKDNKLQLLIEYDGKQHFKPNDFFGGQKAFEDTRIRDEIKNRYCKDNNIPLLRIPYTEESNIEKIVVGKLKELGLI